MRSTIKGLIISIITCLFGIAAMGQSIVTTQVNGMLPDTFLNRYFAGEDVKLNNCKFNWSSSAINGSQVGTFTNTNPQFPFSSGILLTTGNISVAEGPSSSGSSSSTTGVNHAAVDPDLQPLVASGQTLNNASVLEFNFYSGRNENSNVVSFNYIFASEEYPEFVCSSFNDVFGFFLYGPDPFGMPGNVTKNMAIIPGSGGLPVSINTLNNGTAAGSATPCILTYSNFYRNNSGGAIEYDGFTTNLVAEGQLCACSEYKMKISIANVSDGAYDSGVFLEKGSFRLPKEIFVTDSITKGLDTVIMNCNRADIDIHYGEPLERSMNVILYSDGGTAEQEDFYVLRLRSNNLIDTLYHGDTIFFPEGDTLIQLKMMVREEAQFNAHQTKKVQLVFKSVLCPTFKYLDGRIEERSQYDTLVYNILDNKRFTLTSDSVFSCDRCEHVAIQMEGGTEPLLYNWTPSTGLVNPHARESNCNITQNTTFQVTVSDRWGCMVDTCYHTALVTSTPVLEGHFHISPNVICVPEEVQFTSTATPASTHRWIIYSGNMRDTIYGSNQTYTFTDPGHYSIDYKAYEAEACAAEISMVNYINAGLQPTASFFFDPAEAEVGQTVMFTNESTGIDIHYNWSFGDGTNSTEENPTHVYNSENSENYNVILTVSDEAGCQDMYTLPVPVVDNHVLYVPNSFTPNKDGVNDVFLPVVACVAKYYIIIYDRSGSIVFTSDDPEIGWEGTLSNGQECPSGVYTYYINYVRYNNLKQELIKTGNIYLIR